MFKIGNHSFRDVIRDEMQYKSQKNPKKYILVTFYDLHKKLRMEVEEDLVDYLSGSLKAGSPEKDPTETYKVEGKHYTYDFEIP